MSVILLFVSCPFSVYASDHGGSGGTDHNSDFITDTGTINVKDDGVVMYYIEYIISQIGAIVCDHDITKAMANDLTMKEYISKGKYDPNKKTVVFPKETVVYVKQCLDQYAQEHESYTMYRTVPLTSIPYTAFNNQSNVYQSLKNLIADSSSGVVGVSFSWATGAFTFTDIGSHFKDVGLVKYYYDGKGYKAEVKAYEISTWKHANYPRYRLTLSDEDAVIKDKEDFIARATETFTSYSEYLRFVCFHDNVSIQSIERNVLGTGNQVSNVLVSSDSRRIRVYNTYADFQDYTLNKRKVYYTSNYYNYVPEDLTVSIDDLQKEVDDLSKVIDQLLDQISKDTDESEIEELLKQILEELKKDPGISGGGGGGDVNVDIDLSTTNGLLSKILAKVTEIFDKISETAGGAVDTVNTKLQETLDEILSTLKSIRRWSIADTVFDGVDALADVASFLKDFLTAPAAAIGTAASSLGETANMLTDKFPFSIPWDMAALVTLLSAEPQAPVFKLPITIESAGIEEYMEIDMSQFEYLSTIMRGMLSILYAYGILSMTTKVMDIGGKK